MKAFSRFAVSKLLVMVVCKKISLVITFLVKVLQPAIGTVFFLTVVLPLCSLGAFINKVAKIQIKSI